MYESSKTEARKILEDITEHYTDPGAPEITVTTEELDALAVRDEDAGRELFLNVIDDSKGIKYHYHGAAKSIINLAKSLIIE